MISLKRVPKNIWILLPAVSLAAIAGVGIAQSRLARKQQRPVRKVIRVLPPVISKVENLRVVSATIDKQGQANASVIIEIQNDSDKAVTGVTLTFGEVSIGKDGGIFSDPPLTVIEPQGTIVIDFPLSNIIDDETIFVAAAIYADNTEAGHDIVLETMHRQRTLEKIKRDAENRAGKQ